MIPEHYSPTAMFCYHECHRKYYLKYVEKIQVPLSVRLLEGDLFHERIAGASRELVAKLFNERKRHYTFPAKDSDASILGGIETALGLYQMWHNVEGGEFEHEVDITAPVSAVLGEDIPKSMASVLFLYDEIKSKQVIMFADLLDVNKPLLVDMKLRTRQTTDVTCRDETQLGLYSIGTEINRGLKTDLSLLSISYAAGGSISPLEIPPIKMIRNNARNTLASYIIGVALDDFAKTPHPLCGNCEYSSECKRESKDMWEEMPR